jgi:glutathione S-transferase
MEETGQPYERVLTDITSGAQKAPEYLAINPMRLCRRTLS